MAMMNTVLLYIIGFLLFLIFIVLLARKKVEFELPLDVHQEVFNFCSYALKEMGIISHKLIDLEFTDFHTHELIDKQTKMVCSEIQKFAWPNLQENSKISEELNRIEILLAKNLRTLDGRHFEEKKEKRKVAQTTHPWKVEKR